MADDPGNGIVPPDWEPTVGGGGPGGPYLFREGRVLVPRLAWRSLGGEVQEEVLGALGAEVTGPELRSVVVLQVPDAQAAIAYLQAQGIAARPDHVYRATAGTQGVSSAPVTFGGVSGAPVTFGGVNGSPVTFGGVNGSPVTFGGYWGAPVTFGGFGVVPVTFGGGGGGCCCSGPTLPATAPSPARSTARKAGLPQGVGASAPGATVDPACVVYVVDTGFAADGVRPPQAVVDEGTAGPQTTAEMVHVRSADYRDAPDEGGDGFLDPASGHATFIAGIVKRLAPASRVEVRPVMTTTGYAEDSQVGAVLEALVDEVRQQTRPVIVNLSFAGYADDDTAPSAVAGALAELRTAGAIVVASAGNDATCRPTWPAASPGVVGVAALDDTGPAWFTNHGPWVQACAPGVDVVSWFFGYDVTPVAFTADAAQQLEPDGNGWATWSGTSFAAPTVAGALARAIGQGATKEDALQDLIEDPALFRLPGLGTVVNVTP